MKCVYLARIENTDLYKIGYTKNDPALRLENLQVGNPFKIILTDYFKTSRAVVLENALHNFYKCNKVDENEIELLGEWFRFDENIKDEFKERCKQIDFNLDFLSKNSTLNLGY